MKLAAKFVLVLVALGAPAQQVIDRMVAVVNKQVILQSELEDSAHIDFLLQGKPLNQLTAQEMDAVLDRMIDQALVQQQIVDKSVLEPTAVEISSRIQDLRTRVPGGDSEEKWQATLAAYGVTEQDVEAHIASQLRELKFIDLRFRTLARVDRGSISEYYRQTLVPELRKEGATVPPLEQVSEKIQQILTEQRIDDLLNSWLQALRSQAHIEKITVDSDVASAGAKR